MRPHHEEPGFTLVELMVVVLIIGILVTIAIPVFNAASWSARQRACHSNQRTIEGAVEQFLAGNQARSRNQCNGMLDAAHVLITTSYIKHVPVCPASNDEYTYTASSRATTCPSSVESHGRY